MKNKIGIENTFTLKNEMVNTETKNKSEREWSNPIEFLMTCIGTKFEYLCKVILI